MILKRNKYLLALVLCFLNIGCANNNVTNNSNMTPKTMQKPPTMSERAVFINMGSKEEPFTAWVDYIGPLKELGKIYDHIFGFKFLYSTNKEDTLYYENLSLREGSTVIDISKYKIISATGQGAIEISNSKDTLYLFLALGTKEFDRFYNNIIFTRIPSITKNEAHNTYLYSDYIECNLQKQNDNEYILTLSDANNSRIPYKLCNNCKAEPTRISFLNREDGKIYFVQRKCFLELESETDIKKLK